MIYKYFKAKWGLYTLRNLRLKLSDPCEFNDPFEFFPAYSKEPIPEDQIQRYIAKHHPDLSGEKRDRFLSNLRDHNLHPQMFSDITTGKMAVTCFSKSKKNILMWAHYGDNHKGVVIGFDETKVASIGGLYEVIYNRERLVFDPTINKVPGTWIYPFIRNKSPCWKYENEVRFIAMREECKTIRNRFFLSFPREAVKVICIGNRCDEYAGKLQDVHGSKFPHASLEVTRLHRQNYALNIIKITKPKRYTSRPSNRHPASDQPQSLPSPSRPS